MLKLLAKTKDDAAVSCWERCGQVCDPACRSGAIRERTRPLPLTDGWRQA